MRVGPSERVWALGSLCYAVSRVCETEMRRKLAILIQKLKRRQSRFKGKQRIQVGLVTALFITQRPERGTGAPGGGVNSLFLRLAA